MSAENPADYLERAAELIALDNGAINRFTTRDVVVEKMLRAVKAQYLVEERAAAEEFLSRLTAEELENLCCGEEESPELSEIPTIVNDILETMFHSM